jgi:hypothetical protein
MVDVFEGLADSDTWEGDVGMLWNYYAYGDAGGGLLGQGGLVFPNGQQSVSGSVGKSFHSFISPSDPNKTIRGIVFKDRIPENPGNIIGDFFFTPTFIYGADFSISDGGDDLLVFGHMSDRFTELFKDEVDSVLVEESRSSIRETALTAAVYFNKKSGNVQSLVDTERNWRRDE